MSFFNEIIDAAAAKSIKKYNADISHWVFMCHPINIMAGMKEVQGHKVIIDRNCPKDTVYFMKPPSLEDLLGDNIIGRKLDIEGGGHDEQTAEAGTEQGQEAGTELR